MPKVSSATLTSAHFPLEMGTSWDSHWVRASALKKETVNISDKKVLKVIHSSTCVDLLAFEQPSQCSTHMGLGLDEPVAVPIGSFGVAIRAEGGKSWGSQWYHQEKGKVVASHCYSQAVCSSEPIWDLMSFCFALKLKYPRLLFFPLGFVNHGSKANWSTDYSKVVSIIQSSVDVKVPRG